MGILQGVKALVVVIGLSADPGHPQPEQQVAPVAPLCVWVWNAAAQDRVPVCEVGK